MKKKKIFIFVSFLLVLGLFSIWETKGVALVANESKVAKNGTAKITLINNAPLPFQYSVECNQLAINLYQEISNGYQAIIESNPCTESAKLQTLWFLQKKEFNIPLNSYPVVPGKYKFDTEINIMTRLGWSDREIKQTEIMEIY